MYCTYMYKWLTTGSMVTIESAQSILSSVTTCNVSKTYFSYMYVLHVQYLLLCQQSKSLQSFLEVTLLAGYMQQVCANKFSRNTCKQIINYGFTISCNSYKLYTIDMSNQSIQTCFSDVHSKIACLLFITRRVVTCILFLNFLVKIDI